MAYAHSHNNNILGFDFYCRLDTSWGLPLALAANLHVPYRIEIGIDDLNHVHIEDKPGKGEFN